MSEDAIKSLAKWACQDFALSFSKELQSVEDLSLQLKQCLQLPFSLIDNLDKIAEKDDPLIDLLV